MTTDKLKCVNCNALLLEDKSCFVCGAHPSPPNCANGSGTSVDEALALAPIFTAITAYVAKSVPPDEHKYFSPERISAMAQAIQEVTHDDRPK